MFFCALNLYILDKRTWERSEITPVFFWSPKWGQSLGVLEGWVSYCFNGFSFWIQQHAVIVHYTVIRLRVEWKPLGLISGLIIQLHLLSCGKTVFQKTIVHTTGRTLKLSLDLHVKSPGNALNNMGGFSLFKWDLALSNILLFFLYVSVPVGQDLLL